MSEIIDKRNVPQLEIQCFEECYNNAEKFKEVRDELGKINQTAESKVLNDMVNHPQHYRTGKIECIDCISAIVNQYDGEQAYDAGQVVKYLYRAPTKQNFMQDLKKAQWYLNRLIKTASKQNK